MKVLHILRSEPDETVAKLTAKMSADNESSVLSLYDEKIDWDSLVAYIFAYDKVICWWWYMEGSLLILVVNEEHMRHVVNLTKAAWERGMRVFVLFSGRGVNLIRDPTFRILEDKATVSICEASFRDYGLADQPDEVPASAAACLATLSSHAELMAQVDRHVVF